MPSKKTTARMGVKGTMAMARHPALRRATVRAARPTAKVGWRVGKMMARRSARHQLEQLEQLGEMARTIGEIVVVYGPPAAEVLGLIEAPKPRRTAPAFAAGVVIGAGAVYFLEPEHGPEHRRRIQELVASPG